MISIKGHFDGISVIIDEPIQLQIGQEVRILVNPVIEPGKVAERLAAFSRLQEAVAINASQAAVWVGAVATERLRWMTQ